MRSSSQVRGRGEGDMAWLSRPRCPSQDADQYTGPGPATIMRSGRLVHFPLDRAGEGGTLHVTLSESCVTQERPPCPRHAHHQMRRAFGSVEVFPMTTGPTRKRLELQFGSWQIAGGMIVFVVICAAAYSLGHSRIDKTELRVPLVIDPAELNIGEVWEQRGFTSKLRIQNRTAADVEILEFRASCPTFKAQPPQLTVPANGDATLAVTFDLVGHGGSVGCASRTTSSTLGKAPSEEAFGPFEIGVIPVTGKQGSQSKPWILRGVVRSALAFSSRDYDFGDRLIRGQPFDVGKVVLRPLTPLQSVQAECDNRVLSAETRSEGDRWVVEMAPQDSLPVGPFKSSVALQVVTCDGQRLPKVLLSSSGRIVEDIEALPPALLFGGCALGDSVEETVVLSSRTGRAFDVIKVECDTHDVTLSPLKRPSPMAQGFCVKQHIRRAGSQSTLVRFSVRYPLTNAELTIPLRVSYFGVSPAPTSQSGGGNR